MQQQTPLSDKPSRAGGLAFSLVITANALALLAVAIWFRCRLLDNVPGCNGDEAWYGVQAYELLRGGPFRWQTPTGNPINLLFFLPVVAVNWLVPPSFAALRSVAMVSGLAALVINWTLCRWVFDRRMANISTIVLAILPINVAYSRFAWDASQSLAATLPVVYLALAAVRFPRHHIRWMSLAIVAQIVAIWVHPTNIFAGAAIVAALAVRHSTNDHKDAQPTQATATPGARQTANPRRLAIAAIVAILLGLWTVHLTDTPLPGRIAQRLGNLRELTQPNGLPHFSVLYARLFTGGTIYRYIAGSHSWFEWPLVVQHAEDVEPGATTNLRSVPGLSSSAENTGGPAARGAQPSDRVGRLETNYDGWGIDVGLFWVTMLGSAWVAWRSWGRSQRQEDGVLVAAWILGLAGFLLIAGPGAMGPGEERFSLCLIAPVVVLMSRAATLCWAATTSRWRTVLVVGALGGWLMLADFHAHYFRSIEQTGGEAHLTFRTAAVEPKQAALDFIVQQSGDEATWVVCSEWWNYWPIRYLTSRETRIHVFRAEPLDLPAYREALAGGRAWFVEFDDTDAARQVESRLAERRVEHQTITDFAGRPVIRIMRPIAE